MQVAGACGNSNVFWPKPSDLGWTGLHPDRGAVRLGLDLPGPARILMLDCLYNCGKHPFHHSFLFRRSEQWRTYVYVVSVNEVGVGVVLQSIQNHSTLVVWNEESNYKKCWKLRDRVFQKDFIVPSWLQEFIDCWNKKCVSVKVSL